MDFCSILHGLQIAEYSLDDFSPRKSENIQKGYLQGRYGAMPVVNFKDIEW